MSLRLETLKRKVMIINIGSSTKTKVESLKEKNTRINKNPSLFKAHKATSKIPRSYVIRTVPPNLDVKEMDIDLRVTDMMNLAIVKKWKYSKILIYRKIFKERFSNYILIDDSSKGNKPNFSTSWDINSQNNATLKK